MFIVKTTGLNTNPITFDDLGGRTIVHPTPGNGIDFALEFSDEELRNSSDLQNALDNGWITISDGFSVITHSSHLQDIFIPHSLTSHEDVIISNASDKDVIAYDAQQGFFKNFSLQDAGISAIGHTHGDPEIPYYSVSATSGFSTTSMSFSFLSGMEVVVSVAGKYLAMFSCKLETNDSNEYVSFAFYKDGNFLSNTVREHDLTKGYNPFSLSMFSVVDMVQGGQLRVYWKRTNSGTMTVYERELILVRLGA